MKKIILFLSLSVLLMSCVEDNTTSPAKADGVFYGNLSVGDFTEQAGITLTENADSTVNILFDDVVSNNNTAYRSVHKRHQKRRKLGYIKFEKFRHYRNRKFYKHQKKSDCGKKCQIYEMFYFFIGF